MKILVLLSIISLSINYNAKAAASNKADFGGSLNAAKERAVRENKILVLEFTAKWCLPCRFMEKNVFKNPEVQNFSQQHAIMLQIDIDENKSLKEEFNVEVLPTIILMSSTGNILARKEESLNSESFIDWINTNKNASPYSEISITDELNNDEPVVLEVPGVQSTDLETDLLKQLTNSNESTANKNVENHYHLQAGVFSDKENAENMIALLKMNFQQEVIITEEVKDNNTLFKVLIGNFANKEEAVKFQQILEKNNFKTLVRPN
jgi:thioredoxin-related protein